MRPIPIISPRRMPDGDSAVGDMTELACRAGPLTAVIPTKKAPSSSARGFLFQRQQQTTHGGAVTCADRIHFREQSPLSMLCAAQLFTAASQYFHHDQQQQRGSHHHRCGRRDRRIEVFTDPGKHL